MSTFKALVAPPRRVGRYVPRRADRRQASSCRGMAQQIALEIVELYPYVEYMKYLLAGSVALARYVAVMLKDGGFIAIRFGLLFWSALASPRPRSAPPRSSAPSNPAV